MSEYTSNLLCHFVGRSKTREEERFELLVNIIRGEKLISNILNSNDSSSIFNSGDCCENAGEVFSTCDCICFCYFFNDALAIHTQKYSKFGIGFEKQFIAEQGARPVMYVPQNFAIRERGDNNNESESMTPKNPREYFPYVLSVTSSLLPLFVMYMSKEKMLGDTFEFNQWLSLFNSDVVKAFKENNIQPIVHSVLQEMATDMAYVKLYDMTLPDNHPDNYYMEREWRSLHNVHFELKDIKTIYLPNESYHDRFMLEFPDYNGKFYYLENR